MTQTTEAAVAVPVAFNRSPLVSGAAIEQPPPEVVKNTLGLWQADLDTAVRYGGELTRVALGAMDIRGDKRHVVVDTKVHMLMPGQCPAIPGWHTDGAPRAVGTMRGRYSPQGSGPPDLAVQEEWDRDGKAPRFHLLVTGKGCLTEFLLDPVTLEVPSEATPGLYASLTRQVEALRAHPDGPAMFGASPSCRAVEWDWWTIHQGVVAAEREWRYLIRVTESDYHEPLPPSRLDEILRTQSTVYTPMEFGW
jgi:hypothetical protein